MSGQWLGEFGRSYGYDLYHEFLSSAEDRQIKERGLVFGLNVHESLAVHAYSMGFRDGTGCFAELNRRLRARAVRGAFFDPLYADLMSALQKLPKYRGIAYRKTELPLKIRSIITRQSKFRDPAFLSASIDPDVFVGRDILLIQSATGRSIGPLSAFPEEEEILFMPRTPFVVTNVARGKTGALLEMAETVR